jgi:hypothetical protein
MNRRFFAEKFFEHAICEKEFLHLIPNWEFCQSRR